MWPRRKSAPVSADSIAAATLSGAEADALLGELVSQRPMVDDLMERSQREVRLNGFTRRIELAMAMPYPGLGTVTGTE